MRRFLLPLAILVVLAGCLPLASSSMPELNTDDIDLELNTEAEICTTLAYLDAMKAQAFAEGQLAGCKADVVLNNPTYDQLQQFLQDNQDLTRCAGNCVDHAIDLNEAAINAGWAMNIVLLNAEETSTGHVIGAFQTKNHGLVFIEPQTLWEVEVEIGHDYSDNFEDHAWDFPPFTIKQIGVIR